MGAIDEEVMAAVDARGLIREESLTLFLLWHQFGGPNRGESLLDLMKLDAWLIADFQYLFAELAKARKRKKRWEKFRKDSAKE